MKNCIMYVFLLCIDANGMYNTIPESNVSVHPENESTQVLKFEQPNLNREEERSVTLQEITELINEIYSSRSKITPNFIFQEPTKRLLKTHFTEWFDKIITMLETSQSSSISNEYNLHIKYFEFKPVDPNNLRPATFNEKKMAIAVYMYNKMQRTRDLLNKFSLRQQTATNEVNVVNMEKVTTVSELQPIIVSNISNTAIFNQSQKKKKKKKPSKDRANITTNVELPVVDEKTNQAKNIDCQTIRIKELPTIKALRVLNTLYDDVALTTTIVEVLNIPGNPSENTPYQTDILVINIQDADDKTDNVTLTTTKIGILSIPETLIENTGCQVGTELTTIKLVIFDAQPIAQQDNEQNTNTIQTDAVELEQQLHQLIQNHYNEQLHYPHAPEVQIAPIHCAIQELFSHNLQSNNKEFNQLLEKTKIKILRLLEIIYAKLQSRNNYALNVVATEINNIIKEYVQQCLQLTNCNCRYNNEFSMLLRYNDITLILQYPTILREFEALLNQPQCSKICKKYIKIVVLLMRILVKLQSLTMKFD